MRNFKTMRKDNDKKTECVKSVAQGDPQYFGGKIGQCGAANLTTREAA